jgi:hypothetical protein
LHKLIVMKNDTRFLISHNANGLRMNDAHHAHAEATPTSRRTENTGNCLRASFLTHYIAFSANERQP